jgi:hypothetical protein
MDPEKTPAGTVAAPKEPAMNIDEVFLPADDRAHIPGAKPGNAVIFYTDNRKLYAAMLADLIVADGQNDFVYLANWWCDVDVPLGDPNASPGPATLRHVLSFIAKERPDPATASSQMWPPMVPGAQVCGIFWRHKSQIDMAGLPAALLSLPVSIFGDPLLAAINTETVKHIGTCSLNSLAILDGEHRLFGSHHQKFLLIRSKSGLVAYVGSTDFNADRIYPKGGKAKNPPSAPGAPLEDVSCRVTGPAAADVLATFVQRWKLHSDGQGHPLRGESYVAPQVLAGNATVQMTHTYGRGYPFKGLAVRSSADTVLRIVRKAERYVYFEDQYLIGTPELAAVLRDRLNSNVVFSVIGVMAPIDVVGDLPWLAQRRADFWRPLIGEYAGRVKIFEMTNRDQSTSGDGSYLHAKLTLADDTVAAVGSVNFSNRSSTHDSEIMVTVAGDANDADEPKGHAVRVRLERWSRHLGVRKSEILALGDALAKWGRVPSTALVKPWTPSLTPLTAQQNQLYTRVFDPA